MSVFGTGVGRVCAVVAAGSSREARREVHRALGFTSTIELRLDALRSDAERGSLLDWVAAATRGGVLRRAQLVATCRRVEGGGRFRGTPESELRWLAAALQAGCRWCDLEIETWRRLPSRRVAALLKGGRVLLSEHHFDGTPLKFPAVRRRREFAAVKVAARVNRIADSVRILHLARRSPGRLVAVAMGELGTPARILALREGSALAYAPIAAATAPGQTPLVDFVSLYRAHRLTRKTRVYGVIGSPIGHSLSPLMHNSGFIERRIDAVYLPFLVESLPDFLRAIPQFGIRGFSVTIPHKQKILRYLDDCEPLAREIGAVNTVVVDNRGRLKGFNTDHLGVLRALEPRMKLPGSWVLILGTGGGARAAAFAVARAGAAVFLCGRRQRAARELAERVGGGVIRRQDLAKARFDAIIHATPIGMHPHESASPLQDRELNCDLVMDLIYRPMQTRLLEAAARLGLATVSGVEMFLAQGFAQWQLWNPGAAPKAVMRRAVLRELRRPRA